MRYKVRVAPSGDMEGTLDGKELTIGEEVNVPEKGIHKVETIIQNRSLGQGTIYIRKVG